MAIGPIDTAIVFGGLTDGVHRPERFRLAFRAVLIAGGVLLGFALFGVQILGALHVPLDAFRFAGCGRRHKAKLRHDLVLDLLPDFAMAHCRSGRRQGSSDHGGTSF